MFFRGLLPSILMLAPHSAIYFAVYESLASRVHHRFSSLTGLPDEGLQWTVANLSAGIVAGLAATIVSQPMDVIRARVQSGIAEASVMEATKGIHTYIYTYIHINIFF